MLVVALLSAKDFFSIDKSTRITSAIIFTATIIGIFLEIRKERKENKKEQQVKWDFIHRDNGIPMNYFIDNPNWRKEFNLILTKGIIKDYEKSILEYNNERIKNFDNEPN